MPPYELPVLSRSSTRSSDEVARTSVDQSVHVHLEQPPLQQLLPYSALPASTQQEEPLSQNSNQHVPLQPSPHPMTHGSATSSRTSGRIRSLISLERMIEEATLHDESQPIRRVASAHAYFSDVCETPSYDEHGL